MFWNSKTKRPLCYRLIIFVSLHKFLRKFLIMTKATGKKSSRTSSPERYMDTWVYSFIKGGMEDRESKEWIKSFPHLAGQHILHIVQRDAWAPLTVTNTLNIFSQYMGYLPEKYFYEIHTCKTTPTTVRNSYWRGFDSTSVIQKSYFPLELYHWAYWLVGL